MSETTFHCGQCGKEFTVKPEVLARYPGWTPRVCWPCKNKSQGKPASAAKTAARQRRPPRRPAAAEENLTGEQVLAKYTEGPKTGVFTDGACVGNPGPGGWGVVWVEDDAIRAEKNGRDPSTTNNRMELTALIHGFDLVPAGRRTTAYSDSRLAVDTVNKWAAGWAARGWKRKSGEIANLDLVKALWKRVQARPEVTVEWLAAHAGNRWNEYADALSTAYRRAEV